MLSSLGFYYILLGFLQLIRLATPHLISLAGNCSILKLLVALDSTLVLGPLSTSIDTLSFSDLYSLMALVSIFYILIINSQIYNSNLEPGLYSRLVYPTA